MRASAVRNRIAELGNVARRSFHEWHLEPLLLRRDHLSGMLAIFVSDEVWKEAEHDQREQGE